VVLPPEFLQHAQRDEEVWSRLGSRPDLYQHFVQGAEAFISKNMSTCRGLCNGTPCVLQSFGYYDKVNRDLFDVAVRASNDPVILVPTPDYVLVRVDGFKKLIPLQLKDTKSVHVPGLQEKLSVTKIPYDIGFSVTAHKVQGRTVKRIVLHLSAAMNLAGIHVAMSRVEYAEHLRLFPVEDWRPILRKTWDEDLKAFALHLKE